MFGLHIFAYNYFATVMGERDAGQLWVNQCPSTDAWNNLPLENTSWDSQSRNTANWSDQKENTIITKRCT